MEGYNSNTQLNENSENINNNQQNIQEEKNIIPENDINQKIENEIKEEKSIKEVDFFLMDNSQLQKYLEAKNYSENVINQIVENNLTSKDLINIVKSEESLKNLFGENYHDINSLKSLIKNEIEKVLKITILIDDNREITMTLENDPEYTLENITHNLALILDSSNKIFLTPKSVPNEILLPNIKIIPRILSNPEKYSNLKIFNLRNIKVNNKNSLNDSNLNQGYTSYNAYMATQSVLQPNIYNSGYSSINLHNRYKPGQLSNKDKNNIKTNDSVYSTLNILSQSNNYTMKYPDNSYNNNFNRQMYNYSSKVNENDLNTKDYSGNYLIPNKDISENKYSTSLKPNNQYTTNIKNSEYSSSYKIETKNNEINKEQNSNQKSSFQPYPNYKIIQ